MRLVGLVATVVALFISGNFLRRFSWRFSALITPLVVLITGIFFFAFFLYKDSGAALKLAAFFGSTPLVMSVFFGTLQNTLSRASKYTLFDATKEIAFIPLDKESKRKGKAAIDGVGSRLGKSSGSVITQGFLILFATLTASAPYIGLLFIVILVVWVISATSLGKQFNQLVAKHEKIAITEAKVLPDDKSLKKEELKNYFPFASSNKKDKIEK